jgi:hypothetical protein
MAQLEVSSVNVATLIERLRKREWLIPFFQREFIWSGQDVTELVESIISARPIGMATIWEQSDASDLKLESISVPDVEGPTFFQDTDKNPNKVYAVLDGRQRCTAIALAFAGFRAKDGRMKHAGRYFLDATEPERARRIKFVKEGALVGMGLNTDAGAISKGYFPLSSSVPGEAMLMQWLRYAQAIRDPAYYPNGQLPPPEELARRDTVLKQAFDGLNETKLAVYVVPQDYTLAEICEIFETLNTTGVKVSTVDLIHAWISSETANEVNGPLLLRDWINELGQRTGAVGWASSGDRPELTAQLVTACHVALEEKAAPRRVGRSPVTTISSVKAADLLALPTEHWRSAFAKTQQLAEFLSDFQQVVARGHFPAAWCPYPVAAGIYVALRWHHAFDEDRHHPWQLAELNALYRAFFWRNALGQRYDQGFLSQLGTDIKKLKELLKERPSFSSASEWAEKTNDALEKYMSGSPIPSEEQLYAWLTNGRQGGALQKALELPMLAAINKDFVDPEHSLAFPEAEATELHHIYPKGWCANNRVGALADLLDPKRAGKEWVNSLANLMPLSRQTNNLWRAKNPGQLLRERRISFDTVRDILGKAFIDQEAYEALYMGADGLPRFWERRATLMSSGLSNLTKIRL